MTLSSIIGWAGTILIVLAYFLVSTRRVAPASTTYQFMNIVGAVGLGISAYTNASWPNFGLQVIWFFIGFYSLYKILIRKEAKTS